MRTFITTLFLALSPVPAAKAEYRVFLLQIQSPATEPGQPAQTIQVESTLDPDQYRTYYLVPPNAIIRYSDTWRCYGRTDDFKPFCRSPRAPALDADGNPLAPTATTAPAPPKTP